MEYCTSRYLTTMKRLSPTHESSGYSSAIAAALHSGHSQATNSAAQSSISNSNSVHSAFLLNTYILCSLAAVLNARACAGPFDRFNLQIHSSYRENLHADRSLMTDSRPSGLQRTPRRVHITVSHMQQYFRKHASLPPAQQVLHAPPAELYEWIHLRCVCVTCDTA